MAKRKKKKKSKKEVEKKKGTLDVYGVNPYEKGKISDPYWWPNESRDKLGWR